MLRNKKNLYLTTLLMFYLMLTTGSAQAAQEIRFGYLVADQLHSPAVMIMKEKKMLEEAGVAVKWNEYLAGANAMQDMASGAIEFASCGAVPIMITFAQGVDVAVLAGANAEGSSLVVSNDMKTVKDLDGKSIGTPGIGSIQDAMVEQVAKTNNIKISRKSMKVSDMPLFLNKKEIDGFISWAPHPANAVSLGYGHQLLTSHDMFPGHQCCVLVVRGDTMKNDPETTRKVLAAYLKAYQWFLNNKDESIAIMGQKTGMKEEVIRTALQTVQYPFPPFCNVPSMKSMAEGLIATNKIITKKSSELDTFMAALYQPQMLEVMVAKE